MHKRIGCQRTAAGYALRCKIILVMSHIPNNTISAPPNQRLNIRTDVGSKTCPDIT